MKTLRDLRNSDEFILENAKLEFALELKRVMERDHVSNTELAQRLEVSKPMISKLLRGDANATIETMAKASKCLNGKLFIRIIRDGCNARFFEIVKNAHAPEGRRIPPKKAVPVPEYDNLWKFAANDLKVKNDEAEPIAA
ncbi:helix-turn-helix domain-containing protein [Pseudoxanthomonas mexicana]